MTAELLLDVPESGIKTGSDAVYRIAGTLDARVGAFELVYRKYVEAGLIQPNRFRLRVTRHHLLPTTSIFVALERARVICTMTLVGDGKLGLPMESIYPDEVLERRRNRFSVGEVSCLAFEPMNLNNSLAVFVQLTRLMAQHARSRGMDQLMIVVHPQHVRFYERFMGYQRVGPLRTYPAVQNAPAVALYLDFAAVDQNRPRCWTTCFGSPLPAEELRSQPMTARECEYFSPMTEYGECPSRELRVA